jgi:hypothetical protein
MLIWIISSNIIKSMSTFRSSALCLMPPQLHEKVGKWIHEPWSNLNHKKHLFDAFTFTSIFSTILFRKYKNIFTFLPTQPKPKKHHYRIIFTLLHYYLLYRIAHYFLFLLTFTSCAWQPLGGVETQEQENCFACCSKKNDESFCNCSPRVRY